MVQRFRLFTVTRKYPLKIFRFHFFQIQEAASGLLY